MCILHLTSFSLSSPCSTGLRDIPSISLGRGHPARSRNVGACEVPHMRENRSYTLMSHHIPVNVERLQQNNHLAEPRNNQPSCSEWGSSYQVNIESQSIGLHVTWHTGTSDNKWHSNVLIIRLSLLSLNGNGNRMQVLIF